MYDSPELQRAIAHLEQGYGRLPFDLVVSLIDQGIDPESLVQHFAAGARP
ncbi:hypothetical protein [Xylophilus sp.]|nr:hypothetical protein [Xylophilus sp.]KAF1049354.1 MAG: hypothetical protein GAK38_00810 [Xylophilus sp.]